MAFKRLIYCCECKESILHTLDTIKLKDNRGFDIRITCNKCNAESFVIGDISS